MCSDLSMVFFGDFSEIYPSVDICLWVERLGILFLVISINFLLPCYNEI